MAPLLACHGNHLVITSMKADCLLYSLSDSNRSRSAIDLLAKVPSGADKKDIDFEATGVVLAMAFSSTGKYFAVTNDYKQVFLLQTSDLNQEWQLLCMRDAPKKGVRIQFACDETQFIMADKFGDVVSYSTVEIGEEGTVILGHLSMLLDVTFLSNDSLIASCDRDEKVRVSNFPNTYNIQSFCLGHTKYVTSMARVGKLLASGSGDGTVRLWNPMTGEELSRVSCDSVVKSLSFVSECKMLVCSTEVSLLILSLTDDFKLCKGQELKTAGIVLAHCAADNKLIILQDCKQQAVVTVDLNTFEMTLVNHVCNDLEIRWNSFATAVDAHSQFYISLEKAALDNIEEYMERKGKRSKVTSEEQTSSLTADTSIST